MAITDPYRPGLTEKHYQAILHQPKVVAHEQAIGLKGAQMGNDMALIEGAEYGIITQNDPGTRRARVYVAPITDTGTLDDAYHSTLYKVASLMKGM